MTGIDIRGVTKRFDLDGRSLTALDSVDLSVPEGSFAALIGPSGCGKSTLLRLIADVFAPSEGAIAVGGRPPKAARLNHEIGFVFQAATLLPWRTVREKRGAAHRDRGRHAEAQPRGADPSCRPAGFRGGKARAAVGRHAAACRHRPRAGAGAQGPAHGRTLRRAGRDHAPAHERGASAHSGAKAGRPRSWSRTRSSEDRVHGRPGACALGQSGARGGRGGLWTCPGRAAST